MENSVQGTNSFSNYSHNNTNNKQEALTDDRSQGYSLNFNQNQSKKMSYNWRLGNISSIKNLLGNNTTNNTTIRKKNVLGSNIGGSTIIRAISNNVEKRNKANWNMPLAIHNLNNQVAKIIMEL